MMAAARTDSLRGVLLRNEPMSRHTTWRVGGLADQYFTPADVDDLVLFLQQLSADEPLLWLGLGSNLLVRDGGIRGTVIATHSALSTIERASDECVRVQAGVPCAKVARYCASQNLVGAEFFAGIPGTVGGALAMNAGAFGGETWPIVDRVETIDRRGERRIRTPAQFEVGYRSVRGPEHEWFVGAWLGLTPGDGEQGLAKIKSMLERRNNTQPIGSANCGSVFRNPDGDFAGRLVEQSGLKGQCVGGACVSQKHANFIVNAGGATAADIEQLMTMVQQTVFENTGILLHPEAHIVGEAQ